jgi:hypothetical protein
MGVTPHSEAAPIGIIFNVSTRADRGMTDF